MIGIVYICFNLRLLILNQLYFNVVKCNVQVCRKIIKYFVFVGVDMDVCLIQFGYCNFIFLKYVYIFYDEVRLIFLYVYFLECIYQGFNFWVFYIDQFVVFYFFGLYFFLVIQKNWRCWIIWIGYQGLDQFRCQWWCYWLSIQLFG